MLLFSLSILLLGRLWILIISIGNLFKLEKQEKTKSELKAERRAKQEAQRAAKELLQGPKPSPANAVKKQDVKTTDKLKPILPTIVNGKVNLSFTYSREYQSSLYV